MESSKPLINVVFMGHVDHGKSTLIGRFLYEVGQISEEYVERLKEVAKIIGKGKKTYYWAYVIDFSEKERGDGHTIEVSFWEPVETKTNIIKILDVPGHRLWMSNMIAGVSQADAAIFVIGVNDIINKGIRTLMELREHLLVAIILGIDQVIVTINKMDLVEYEQRAFEKVKEEITKFMGELGYRKPEKLVFLPLSAFHGENITERSEKMPWYNGQTLIEAIEMLEAPSTPIDKPLRLPILRHYDKGNIAVGTVKTGTLSVGDTVVVMPIDVMGKVVSIEAWGKQIQKAYPRDDIGIRIKGVARYNLKRGFVIGSHNNPPTVARKFNARIHVTSPRGIWPNYSPTIHCHTAQMACKIEAIICKIDPNTGMTIQENPSFLKQNEVGEVTILPLPSKVKGLVIEKYNDFPELGRFALRDQRTTIAAGICIDIEKCI